MKVKSILPVLFFAAGPCMAAPVSPSPALAEAEYRKGQAAEKTGDPTAAREAYTRALQADPRHAHAHYSLGQLRITSAAIAAKGRESKFAALPVAEYRASELTLGESLALLTSQLEKNSKKAPTPNFVIEDPTGKLAAAKVTISLKGVPAGGVLRYILDQAGAKARYDEHAIVISPQ